MMIFALIIKSLAAFSELAIPRMMAVIVDEDVPSGDVKRVLISGGVMIFFAFLTFLLNIVGNRAAARASANTAYDLRRDLFTKTVKLDTAATDKYGLPSLTSRLTSDTYNITAFMARMLRMGVKAPLMLVGGIVITLTIDARLALILIAILPFVSLTVFLITKKSIPLYKEEQKILDDLVRRVDETHSGVRVIKALSKTEYEKKRFREASGALSDKEIEAGRLVSLTKPINDLLFYLGFCFVILFGAALSRWYGFDAVGKLLAFMTYFTVILNNMIMMTRIFVQTSRSAASAARIEEVLLTESNLLTEEAAEEASDAFISFENVTFSYNKVAPNVDGVSFTLGRGETLGIIGVTGSGKTTIINLLLRLYDADSGTVRVGGRDVKTIPKEELHSMFGVSLQNDFLFSGTVEENVAFFRECERGELAEAAEVAQAADFIEKTEKQWEHAVTTGGTNVSGGQKQRLTVARAVLGVPEILILDDSSSALDYKTDATLRRSVKERVKTTTIIVAQRISSVKDADKILVIDEGRITASGTHEELLLTSEDYREIAAVQMGGAK